MEGDAATGEMGILSRQLALLLADAQYLSRAQSRAQKFRRKFSDEIFRVLSALRVPPAPPQIRKTSENFDFFFDVEAVIEALKISLENNRQDFPDENERELHVSLVEDYISLFSCLCVSGDTSTDADDLPNFQDHPLKNIFNSGLASVENLKNIFNRTQLGTLNFLNSISLRNAANSAIIEDLQTEIEQLKIKNKYLASQTPFYGIALPPPSQDNFALPQDFSYFSREELIAVVAHLSQNFKFKISNYFEFSNIFSHAAAILSSEGNPIASPRREPPEKIKKENFVDSAAGISVENFYQIENLERTIARQDFEIQNLKFDAKMEIEILKRKISNLQKILDQKDQKILWLGNEIENFSVGPELEETTGNANEIKLKIISEFPSAVFSPPENVVAEISTHTDEESLQFEIDPTVENLLSALSDPNINFEEKREVLAKLSVIEFTSANLFETHVTSPPPPPRQEFVENLNDQISSYKKREILWQIELLNLQSIINFQKLKISAADRRLSFFKKENENLENEVMGEVSTNLFSEFGDIFSAATPTDTSKILSLSHTRERALHANIKFLSEELTKISTENSNFKNLNKSLEAELDWHKKKISKFENIIFDFSEKLQGYLRVSENISLSKQIELVSETEKLARKVQEIENKKEKIEESKKQIKDSVGGLVKGVLRGLSLVMHTISEMENISAAERKLLLRLPKEPTPELSEEIQTLRDERVSRSNAIAMSMQNFNETCISSFKEISNFFIDESDENEILLSLPSPEASPPSPSPSPSSLQEFLKNIFAVDTPPNFHPENEENSRAIFLQGQVDDLTKKLEASLDFQRKLELSLSAPSPLPPPISHPHNQKIQKLNFEEIRRKFDEFLSDENEKMNSNQRKLIDEILESKKSTEIRLAESESAVAKFQIKFESISSQFSTVNFLLKKLTLTNKNFARALCQRESDLRHALSFISAHEVSAPKVSEKYFENFEMQTDEILSENISVEIQTDTPDEIPPDNLSVEIQTESIPDEIPTKIPADVPEGPSLEEFSSTVVSLTEKIFILEKTLAEMNFEFENSKVENIALRDILSRSNHYGLDGSTQTDENFEKIPEISGEGLGVDLVKFLSEINSKIENEKYQILNIAPRQDSDEISDLKFKLKSALDSKSMRERQLEERQDQLLNRCSSLSLSLEKSRSLLRAAHRDSLISSLLRQEGAEKEEGSVGAVVTENERLKDELMEAKTMVAGLHGELLTYKEESKKLRAQLHHRELAIQMMAVFESNNSYPGSPLADVTERLANERRNLDQVKKDADDISLRLQNQKETLRSSPRRIANSSSPSSSSAQIFEMDENGAVQV